MQDDVTRAQSRLGRMLRGKYRLDKILGVGGMGIVYKATHRNRAEFAIKMLLPELSNDPDTRSRFLREGYAANSVKHPGVVAVVDDDVAEDGAAFLVMELLAGQSVEDLAEQCGGSLPPEVVSSIAYQLLDVLTVAHAAGVVHRDLKPANLFVTTSGQVKVLDFGIARLRDALMLGAQATQSGITFGTPAFMPPEQAGGRTRDIDERTDVWAVGALMFTLLSSKLVHEGGDGAAIMVKAATSRARPLASVAPSVPNEVAHVVDRALSFEKSGRWASAAEMRDALLRAHQACFGEPPAQAKLQAFCLAASGYVADAAPSDAAATRIRPLRAAENAGESTTKGVSSDKHAKARTRLAFGGALIIAGLGVAAGFVAMARLHTSAVPAGASTESIVATAAAPAPVESKPEVAASLALPSAEPPPSASTSGAPVPAKPTLREPPKAKPKPAPTGAGGSTAAPKPNCNPPYTLDADGNKHFKKECF